MRAKGQMIARAAGYDLPLGEDVKANFAELRYLERAIGPTGRLALQPFLQTSGRESVADHDAEAVRLVATGRAGSGTRSPRSPAAPRGGACTMGTKTSRS